MAAEGNGAPSDKYCLKDQPYYIQYDVEVTGKKLGRGSFGEVLEAKIPGGVCAVKKMSDAISTQEEGWEMFHKELNVLTRLRHPHIVQFLGVKPGIEGFNIPALVTEKLSTDLHSMLLHEAEPVPLNLKFSILHDVAGGLFFLHSHSPVIIHRDLTATNVLLNSAMVAKIADLGMARLIPDGTEKLTIRPGNLDYMPPEAYGNRYEESLDVFSFGVLALFTLTQIYPEPLSYKYTENGKSFSRSEVDRRSTFLRHLQDEVKDQRKLVATVKQCLDDVPEKRPNIKQDILPLLKPTEYCDKSKLDLVRMIERERKEHKNEEEVRRREQTEEMDRHEREQMEERDRHEREQMEERDRHEREQMEERDRHEREQMEERDRHEREKDKLKSELNKLQGMLDVNAVQMDQKEKAMKRELEEKKKEYRLSVGEMKKQQDIITQMKRERKEEAKQRERGNVREPRERFPAGRGDGLGVQGGDRLISSAAIMVS